MNHIEDIIAKLFGPKGLTPQRIEKAQGAAKRVNVSWADVLAAMTEDQRKAIHDAA